MLRLLVWTMWWSLKARRRCGVHRPCLLCTSGSELSEVTTFPWPLATIDCILLPAGPLAYLLTTEPVAVAMASELFLRVMLVLSVLTLARMDSRQEEKSLLTGEQDGTAFQNLVA